MVARVLSEAVLGTEGTYVKDGELKAWKNNK